LAAAGTPDPAPCTNAAGLGKTILLAREFARVAEAFGNTWFHTDKTLLLWKPGGSQR
jgi:hypothetical protein